MIRCCAAAVDDDDVADADADADASAPRVLQAAVLSDDECNRGFRYMCLYPQPWSLWLKPGQMTPFSMWPTSC